MGNEESGIYQIMCIANERIYIGSSKHLSQRKDEHFESLRRNVHWNQHLQYSFNKYGRDNFEFSIIEYCLSEKRLEIEQLYLDFIFDPILFDQSKKFNLYPSAGSSRNSKMSEETKRKISESGKGRIVSKETTDKMVATNKERYGGSPKRRLIAQIDLETGEIITIHESVTAAKATGVSKGNLADVAAKRLRKGKNGVIYMPRTLGGFLWEYINEESA